VLSYYFSLRQPLHFGVEQKCFVHTFHLVTWNTAKMHNQRSRFNSSNTFNQLILDNLKWN
jgi:hypothetical protein